jgi:pimeloyl-ACP methyl ester carboxylesterase
LPHLNFSWELLNLDPFTKRFTVIVASPRGFAASARLGTDAGYRVADLAVVKAAGFERFSVFGYSLTGAFAPWLAHLTGRVDAVVSGGFPIVGDYSPLYNDIQDRSAAARSEPAAWADLQSRFDDRATLAFYRELSSLPPDFLVDDLPCPLFAFWGEADEEITLGGGTALLSAGLDQRGVRHVSYPGHDHEGMLSHIDEAVPDVLTWFDQL